MPKPMQVKACAAGLTLAFLLSACSGEEFDAPTRLAVPPEATLFSFGGLADGAGGEALALVRHAILSESGQYLALGDYEAPFLRVVDRSTGAASSFGNSGEGPGEMRGVASIAFLGDSLLLVLTLGQRLERFTPAGEWIGGNSVREAGVAGYAMSVGCGGRLYMYGLPVGARARGDIAPAWVHEVQVNDTLTSLPLLTIAGALSVAYGSLQGFQATSDGVMIWHKPSDTGYWLPCGEREADIWTQADPVVTQARAVTDNSGNRGMALILPDTVFNGAAATAGVMLTARSWGRGGTQVTAIRAVADRACREVELLGTWWLLHAHLDGIVLSSSNPFPSAKIIDWEWLQGSMTPVRCA